MGVAAPWAPVDGRGPRPLKRLVTGLSLLGSCYLANNFHKKIRMNPSPLEFKSLLNNQVTPGPRPFIEDLLIYFMIICVNFQNQHIGNIN